MIRPFCRRGRPPWWPAGEPWPPPHRRFGLHPHRRARFFRWIAFVVLTVLLFAISGLFGAAWMIANRFGLHGSTAAIALLFVLFAAAMIATAMFGGMRRFASPLWAVMDAADRVAEGDYAVRVQENGPPPIRALAHSFNTMAERLQDADRLRRDLMADVAHELRTPLSVLQGRLEGLLDGVYAADEHQLSQLLEETHVLSRLVEDLRTLALSEAGALPLQRESTDVTGLVREVAQSMQPEAARKSVTVNVTTSGEPAVIDLDPVRIREVLTNLLSNAIRYTGSSGTVTAAVSDTSEGVAVAVTDTGQGMPPDEVRRIFDRFYKGSVSRGSGLGLTIAKGIVVAHGGEITASSELGKGTTVTFTLPR